MSTPKEPDFFNRFDDVNVTMTQSEINDYLKIFDNRTNESVIGEASVSYLPSLLAAHHIRKFSPESSILILLRNPLERIRSLYEMYVRHGLKETFEYAAITDGWLTRQCFYYEYIKRYYDEFPRNRILWIEHGELKHDWNKSVERIHNFLGVRPLAGQVPVVRNTGGIPSHPLYKIFINRKIISFGKKIIPKQFHNIVDQKIKSTTFKHITINKDQYHYLQKEFKSDIVKLDALIQSNFIEKWLSEER